MKCRIHHYLLTNYYVTLNQTSVSLGPTSTTKKKWMALHDPNSKARNSVHSFQLFVFQLPHLKNYLQIDK